MRKADKIRVCSFFYASAEWRNKVRRFVSFILFLILPLCLSACSDSGGAILLDNSDKSSFVDFYTRGDVVYIECVLNIYSEKDAEVTVTALDNEDVETGLLKNNRLVGETADGEKTFSLQRGENNVTVYFAGEYAGIFKLPKDKFRGLLK